MVQLNSEMCSGHVKCTTCAVDPQCAWLVVESKCASLAEVQSINVGSVHGSVCGLLNIYCIGFY